MSFLGATFREPCLQAAKMGWRVLNNLLSSRKSFYYNFGYYQKLWPAFYWTEIHNFVRMRHCFVSYDNQILRRIRTWVCIC